MTEPSQQSLLEDHSWARDLLVEKFRANIQAYLNSELVSDRVMDKARFGDDVYEAMLSSVDRSEYLSWMTLWSVGQGIGVRVRHWIEDAVKELILYQQEHFGREIESVYTFSDLRRGCLLAENDSVAMAGEEATEHSHKKHWLVPVRESVVRVAERLSEEVARRYELSKSYWQWNGERLHPHVWETLPDLVTGSLEGYPVEKKTFQLAWLRQAALSPVQQAVVQQKIICNLLVLEKPPGKVRAFRFASPGLKSLRSLRDEKRNLLLLYGWLRQEKPFRVYQDSVEVFWTHLMARPVSSSQASFFQEQVLVCPQFWKYVGVPYGVLLESLAIAGRALKAQIRAAVRRATPRSIRNWTGTGKL